MPRWDGWNPTALVEPGSSSIYHTSPWSRISQKSFRLSFSSRSYAIHSLELRIFFALLLLSLRCPVKIQWKMSSSASAFNDESMQGVMITVPVAITSVALVFSCLRLVARLRARISFGYDDVVLWLSMASLFTLSTGGPLLISDVYLSASALPPQL